MIKFLQHFFDTKGLYHAFERFLEVVWRFALGGRRLDQVIDLIERVFGPRNFRMTFFVSAGTVHRHLSRIERLRDLGHDIGSHGIYHSRMDMHALDTQIGILNESHHVLEAAGFGVQGFRPPYLNYDGETRTALISSPFSWTSGEVIFWDNRLENGDSIERLGPLYHFHHADRKLCLPNDSFGVLDIPVSAPDDEILYERYRVRDPNELEHLWCQIFEDIRQQGELFHILFHPERFRQIHDAVGAMVDHVQSCNPSVWMTKVDELAEWWKLRYQWIWQRVDNGRVQVSVPKRGTLLLKESTAGSSAHQPLGEGRVAVSPLYKNYCPTERSETYPGLTIGLSERCPKELENFLHREGFLAEFTDQPEKHSLYLDRTDFSDDDARKLLEEIDSSEKPLLRLWRWPDGHQAAFCVSADICAVDLRDFWERTRNF